jgi:hypothetical protein
MQFPMATVKKNALYTINVKPIEKIKNIRQYNTERPEMW